MKYFLFIIVFVVGVFLKTSFVFAQSPTASITPSLTPTVVPLVRVQPCPTQSTFTVLCRTDLNPNKIIQTSIALLLLTAVLFALLFLILGGIRWIMSGGDKAKVDKARGTIVGAVIGLVIAFAAFFILNLVASIFGLGSLLNMRIPSFISNSSITLTPTPTASPSGTLTPSPAETITPSNSDESTPSTNDSPS